MAINLARGRPALQSSISPWSSEPSRRGDAAVAVSGDLTSPRFFHTAEEFFPWWQVDLRGECVIHRVEIENRPYFPERLQRFTLLGSLDGQSWRTLQAVRTAAAPRYIVAFETPRLARFLRVRLDGHGVLHFRQFQAFGERGSVSSKTGDYEAAQKAWGPPQCRSGRIARVGGFDLFIDDAYSEVIKESLRTGGYERRERFLVTRLLEPGDRVMEVGTAIGLVAMTAAAIVGPERVFTFDANSSMVSDALANFARNDLPVTARCGVLVPQAKHVAGENVIFHVSPDFWASRIVGPQSGLPTVAVPTHAFEVERRRTNANVLICDIEGGEIDLLMEADLSALRLVILETHVWAVGTAPTDALIARLIATGFALDLDVSGQGVAALIRR
jgi:FkbM family methyltransferase